MKQDPEAPQDLNLVGEVVEFSKVRSNIEQSQWLAKLLEDLLRHNHNDPVSEVASLLVAERAQKQLGDTARVPSWTARALHEASGFLEKAESGLIDPAVKKILSFLNSSDRASSLDIDKKTLQWLRGADALDIAEAPRDFGGRCIFVSTKEGCGAHRSKELHSLVSASHNRNSTPEAFLRIVTLPVRGEHAPHKDDPETHHRALNSWLCYDVFDIWQHFQEHVPISPRLGLHDFVILPKRRLQSMLGRESRNGISNPAHVASNICRGSNLPATFHFQAEQEPSAMPLEDVEAIARAVQAYLYVRLLRALSELAELDIDFEAAVARQILDIGSDRSSAMNCRSFLLSRSDNAPRQRDDHYIKALTEEAAHILLYLYGKVKNATRMFEELYPQSHEELLRLADDVKILRARLVPHAARNHARHLIVATMRDAFLRGKRSWLGRHAENQVRSRLNDMVNVATWIYSQAGNFFFFVKPLFCAAVTVTQIFYGSSSVAKFMRGRFGDGTGGALKATLHAIFGRQLAEGLTSLRQLFDSTLLKIDAPFKGLVGGISALCNLLIGWLKMIFNPDIISSLWNSQITIASPAELAKKCVELIPFETFAAWGQYCANLLRFLARGDTIFGAYVGSALAQASQAAEGSLFWDLLSLSILLARGNVEQIVVRFLEYNCRLRGDRTVQECGARANRYRRLLFVISALNFAIRSIASGGVSIFADTCVKLLTNPLAGFTTVCVDTSDIKEYHDNTHNHYIALEILNQKTSLWSTSALKSLNVGQEDAWIKRALGNSLKSIETHAQRYIDATPGWDDKSMRKQLEESKAKSLPIFVAKMLMPELLDMSTSDIEKRFSGKVRQAAIDVQSEWKDKYHKFKNMSRSELAQTNPEDREIYFAIQNERLRKAHKDDRAVAIYHGKVTHVEESAEEIAERAKERKELKQKMLQNVRENSERRANSNAELSEKDQAFSVRAELVKKAAEKLQKAQQEERSVAIYGGKVTHVEESAEEIAKRAEEIAERAKERKELKQKMLQNVRENSERRANSNAELSEKDQAFSVRAELAKKAAALKAAEDKQGLLNMFTSFSFKKRKS